MNGLGKLLKWKKNANYFAIVCKRSVDKVLRLEDWNTFWFSAIYLLTSLFGNKAFLAHVFICKFTDDRWGKLKNTELEQIYTVELLARTLKSHARVCCNASWFVVLSTFCEYSWDDLNKLPYWSGSLWTNIKTDKTIYIDPLY